MNRDGRADLPCPAPTSPRNDILNFGRLHFFFPDSRLALDLNTDRTLKEVRGKRQSRKVTEPETVSLWGARLVAGKAQSKNAKLTVYY